MTLTTHIQVLDPVPIDELWDFCNHTLLRAPSTIVTTDEQDTTFVYDPTPGNSLGGSRIEEDPQVRVRRNRPGQDLAALLWVRYAVERPLPSDLQRLSYRDEDLGSGDDNPIPPDHFADVSFDTSYGATNPSCSDLHAALVQQLALWLEARGRRYRWQQEFTGEWYDTPGTSELGDAELGWAQHLARLEADVTS